MILKNCLKTSIAIAAILSLLACMAGKKQFDIGMELQKVAKYEEAVAYLEMALQLEPQNKQYQQMLTDVKMEWINQLVSRGFEALKAQTSLTIMDIDKAQASLVQARHINTDSQNVKDFAAELQKIRQVFLSDIKQSYTQAKQYLNDEKWLQAYFDFQQLENRFPGYEDTSTLLNQVANEGAKAYYEQARGVFEQYNFKDAIPFLRKALSIKADYRPARELLELAEKRDNKAYFSAQAQNLVGKQKWDQALFMLTEALTYEPLNQKLQDHKHRIQTRAGNFYIQNAWSELNAGQLKKAMEHYQQAKKYSMYPSNSEIDKLQTELCSMASYIAESFKEQGKLGSAWYWYKQIGAVNPEYPQISYLTQEMEDNIKQRVMKSIAVFDFSSPSDHQDAGIIVADNLITYLFKNSSGDIKILERENLKSILEEMQPGQIGVVSQNNAKEMGRLYGIDVAIMGSVLLFKVDSSTTESAKTVSYQIGERIEDNIDFLNWKAKHPNPDEDAVAKAPEAKIKVPVIVEKEYIVAHHKKIALIQVSFQIVDVITGENILIKTIEREQMAEDEASAGLAEASVKFDPMEIPTDTELLQNLADKVVDELGDEVLKPIHNMEKTYFQDGKQLMWRGDNPEAIESFINAIFDEKIKQIKDSPLTASAMKHLDEIFREYLVKIDNTDSTD
ncbi:CsgG/HfaB family protein [Desulfococcaceae bacterium HSG7]|nr:CsgG/HfaB family protein [Desulfococcaceae bacterium HSG7]